MGLSTNSAAPAAAMESPRTRAASASQASRCRAPILVGHDDAVRAASPSAGYRANRS